MYSYYGELKYFRAYLIQQLGIFFIIVIYRLVYPKANRLIINNMCMLLTIGFIMLGRLSYDRAMRQFAIAMGAIVITLLVPYLISRVTFFEKFKWIYVGVGVGSLLIVLLFSAVTYGSKLSFTLGSYTFQPSEYVKIVFVFAVASILSTSHDFKEVLLSAAVAAVHILILVASKDLGSAIIFFVVYLSMLFIATRNYLYFISGIIMAALASIVGYKLFSHVRVRVLAFKDPFGNINDAGYQIAQSLFAIGTGGWLGMGITQGAPNTIPVVAADFVFAAICEEFGVVFGMCLILVCLSCFVMFMNIAMRFKDKFFRLVAVGLAVAYGFQVFLTIGGVTKFIPLTGVTLPLVSYGGTSVAVTCCMFAVIQGMYIHRGREIEAVKVELYKRKALHDELDRTYWTSRSDGQGDNTRVQTKKKRIIKQIVNDDRFSLYRKKNGNKSTVEKGFGNSNMDTQMMDEAFMKAVNEGIKASADVDIVGVEIEDYNFGEEE